MSSKVKDLPFPLKEPTSIVDVLVEAGLAKSPGAANHLFRNGKVHIILDCVSPKVLVQIDDPHFKVNPAFRMGDK